MRIGYSLLLLLQASAPPVVYDTQAVTQTCSDASASDTIVVCGRRDKDRYRIPKLPPDEPSYPTAETKVGGASVGVGTEQADVGGFPSNRVMAHIKVPF